MICYRQEVRGIPLWLLQDYLLELGGSLGLDGRIAGDGWSASLIQQADFQVGSLRVAQVLLELEAEPEVWKRLQPSLQDKLMRAGG